MYFEIKDKVALISGGASGIGFQYALALLENKARAVCLADVNPEAGSQAIKEIEKKYGKNKAIFIKTDVTNYGEFEDAFKKTIETFKNIDILINNAGILNDSTWQKEIAINVNGTINGVLLGLENYLPKYKSGSEAVIVNLSSIAGVNAFACIPVYTATKFAVHGLTVAWGDPIHFNATKVRVVGVCPGVTLTPLITEAKNTFLGPRYEEYKNIELDIPLQEPAQVAPRVIEVIQKAENGTMWVIEGGQPPYQYKIENRFEVPKIPLQ